MFPLNVFGSSPVDPSIVAEFKNSSTDTGIALTNDVGTGSAWGIYASGQTSSLNPGSFSIGDFISNQNRLLIDSAGRVGIGTTAPSAALQVRNTPFHTGSTTFFNNAGAMFATANNNGGSSPTGPEPALVLAREGIAGQAFANFARFDLNRYENGGTASRTQLDIGLTHSDLFGEANSTPTIMSLRSNGNVGINNTNPQAALDVSGDIKANNLPKIAFQQGSGFPDGRPFLGPSSTYSPLDQVTVNAGSSGFIHVTATAQPLQGVTASLCARLALNDTVIHLASSTVDLVGVKAPLHVEHVIPVTTGSYTFRTSIENCTGANMLLSDHRLTATFIPQ